MRRLNVALSRAKKKLIIIGNLNTLCSDNAHFKPNDSCEIIPVNVFRKLKEIKERSAEKTSLAKLKDAMENGSISSGTVFTGCKWDMDGWSLRVTIPLNNEMHSFPIKFDNRFKFYGLKEKNINVRFLGIGTNGRPQFEYMPQVSIAQQINDGLVRAFTARLLGWMNDDSLDYEVEFEDHSSLVLNLNSEIDKDDFALSLLDSNEVTELSFFIFSDGTATLNNADYKLFRENHQENENVKVSIIDDSNKDIYIVRCDNIYGKILKKYCRNILRKNSEIRALVFKMGHNSVTFKV